MVGQGNFVATLCEANWKDKNIDQDYAQVDIFRINPEGFWVLEGYEGLDSNLDLRSLKINIPISVVSVVNVPE